ncbi:MAG: CBS domain-containing protein [Alphaproteobacteria bacterium]|nr:CBS domain-containing protein [Alphaproteobacteria bacterium]
MFRRLIPDVVRDQDILALPPEASVREAARRMADRRIGATLVTEAGTLVGIFTERDVMTRVVAAGLDPDTTRIRQVMTANPATVAPDQRALDALKVMHEGGFRHLPVVENGRAVGIVSLRDFLSGELAEMRAELAQEEALTTRV